MRWEVSPISAACGPYIIECTIIDSTTAMKIGTMPP